MYFDDEQETKEERKVSTARKNKSLARKIAGAVMEYTGYAVNQYFDQDDWEHEEKDLAKVIKRVIRKHDAGK